ncbi:MAG TPA: VWA domain-containing protein [Longimicrobiales bacterium]|nr:VWA domain-containing protein [Longimicrobiales bacterium]
MSFGFANPWALLLLPLLGLVLWLMRGRERALTYSRAGTLAAVAGGGARLLARLPGWLRTGALALLIFALAGPRTGAAVVDVNAEGIAIVVALDISSSMLAEDFAPDNRLAVAKRQVRDFIRGRTYDRIGLVAFAGEALTQVPITIDYEVIFQSLDQLRAGAGLLEDGTAIGTAIATAANRLRRAPGESRVMILMTDGENNRGDIDPRTAAQAAAALDIRIYTIGVGSEGVAPIPVATGPFGVQYATVPVSIDDELLTEIADMSGGRYFRATNPEALDSVYQQIDELEKSEVEVSRYMSYTPYYLPFVLLAGMLLMGEWGLRASRFGRLP